MENVVSERDQVRGVPSAAPVRPEDHPEWARVQRDRAACARGDCRYPTPDRLDLRTDGCIGYVGTAHLEDGHIVMRYRCCDRHLRWRHAERERTRERRSREARKPAPRDSGWREGD
jgi:hypothetical protein